MGEEGMVGEITRVVGSRRKRGRLCNIAQYFAIEKNAKRQKPSNAGWKLGLKGTGSGWFTAPCPPPPHSYMYIMRCMFQD